MSIFISISCISLAISTAVPFIFIAMRESVKQQRREIVRDLQTIFSIQGGISEKQGNDSYHEIIPSFEFLKYKYFFERNNPDNSKPKDFSQLQWIAGILPLSITATFINIYCLCLIGHYGFHVPLPEIETLFVTDKDNIPLLGIVIMASYAGGALFMLKSFFRAIRNFDLSPHSFVGSWVNLLLGVTSAIIFIFGLMRMSKSLISWDETSVQLQSLALLTAFVIGRLPDLTNRNLLRAAHLKNYKREDVDVYKSFTAVPVEVIDGIDGEIRDRLTDFHINAVQNLAAANPLMLFVETPYGVYQIMDWVAQAQLCCSVGPTALLQLWKIGVRTIFDLERAVLDRGCQNEHMIGCIGRILVPISGDTLGPIDKQTIVAAVRVRLDKPPCTPFETALYKNRRPYWLRFTKFAATASV